MELSPTHPARAKFRFCLLPDSPDQAVVKLRQFYDATGAPPLTFVPYSPAARELSEIPPGSPTRPVMLPFVFPCQPDNAAAEDEDAAHGGSTTLANMFPTTTIPNAHRHSGLAGTAGTGAAMHRTIFLLSPGTRGAAADNAIANRHPTETRITLCCKVHVRSAIESLCGTGWKYKIRPKLAWFRSFRKHRSFSPQ